MRLTILIMCAGVSLAKPADTVGSAQAQPTAVPDQSGPGTAQGPLVKMMPFLENDSFKQQIQHGFRAAAQMFNRDGMTLNDSTAQGEQSLTIQEIPPSMQNFSPEVMPLIKIRGPDGPGAHQFYPRDRISPMEEFFSNISSQAMEEYTGPDGPGPHHFYPLDRISPMEEFFGNVSSQAMEEYTNLTQSASNVTIAEMKKMMEQWAEKNGIKAQLEDFKGKFDSRKTEFIANATMIVNALPSMFQQLVSITKNEEQTFAEMENSTDAFFQTLDPATTQIMETIIRVAGIDMLLVKPPNWNRHGAPDSFDLSSKMLFGEHRPPPPQFQRFLQQMSHPEANNSAEHNEQDEQE
ncbi:hypothetical protein OESDEN_05403 [Oesophagostomum dentatum]|uniref:SXP/RAL-2 family protein Ani s 5-like cation-binding domain-containing protein n=1 Tax=Oesophagostomum dentatum TaxID=61180 RepID=A0A0B1TH14_OESDE|nr:hypothetical protein OESDEN_05403 [Oesophagostomum dentatum]